MKRMTWLITVAAALMAALLLSGCGEAAKPVANSGVPEEAAMKEIVTRLMPEETEIHRIMTGGLAYDSNDILGTLSYLGAEMRYAKVTDSLYPTWDTLTAKVKGALTDNYLKANYMEPYLLSAEDAKKAEQPPLYLEFDGQLGINIEMGGGGNTEYATGTAVFSQVTAQSFQAVMDSMDAYGSRSESTVFFVKGQDGNWRIDSVVNQWLEDASGAEGIG